jgi:hypothetical protein
MPGGVKSTARSRAIRSANIFLVRFPWDAGVLKLNDEMIRRGEMMRRRIIAVARHSPIRAGLEPKILRQAAKRSGHDEHVAGIRGLRQKDIVDVRRIGAAREILPAHVFHDDEEDGVDIGVAGAAGRGGNEYHPYHDKSQPHESHTFACCQTLENLGR